MLIFFFILVVNSDKILSSTPVRLPPTRFSMVFNYPTDLVGLGMVEMFFRYMSHWRGGLRPLTPARRKGVRESEADPLQAPLTQHWWGGHHPWASYQALAAPTPLPVIRVAGMSLCARGRARPDKPTYITWSCAPPCPAPPSTPGAGGPPAYTSAPRLWIAVLVPLLVPACPAVLAAVGPTV